MTVASRKSASKRSAQDELDLVGDAGLGRFPGTLLIRSGSMSKPTPREPNFWAARDDQPAVAAAQVVDHVVFRHPGQPEHLVHDGVARGDIGDVELDILSQTGGGTGQDESQGQGEAC